jgi:hypothetical protein
MVLGRHRNVMIGDRTTGCIVSSMIQFVQPALLKADLNKKFKERFDGWEPPKSQRKYIGARVIDGIYTLMEPGLDDGSVATASKDLDEQSNATGTTIGTMSTALRNRQGSVSSITTGGDPKETIRMPPSLTLSKIRSLKQQALLAAVKARLEISTVALAIIYFERLCLDCRVDKTNRRLSFAACLLLAIKINEANVGLVTPQQKKEEEATSKNFATMRIQSVYRSTEKSSTMFASLLEVFTQEWEISLKHLYAAEWGVFAALQFRLHAKPSQVAFHFKRLLKSLVRVLHSNVYQRRFLLSNKSCLIVTTTRIGIHEDILVVKCSTFGKWHWPERNIFDKKVLFGWSYVSRKRSKISSSNYKLKLVDAKRVAAQTLKLKIMMDRPPMKHHQRMQKQKHKTQSRKSPILRDCQCRVPLDQEKGRV